MRSPAGPPPSDGGMYVLANFATARASVLVTAQDLFFSAIPAGNAKELLTAVRGGLEPVYAIESEPTEVTIAGHTADVVTKEEPLLTTRRHNTIPVRVIIDAKGRVKHVHLLSAFPEQAQVILAALPGWTFKPYRVGGRAVEVETGLVFGMPLVP